MVQGPAIREERATNILYANLTYMEEKELAKVLAKTPTNTLVVVDGRGRWDYLVYRTNKGFLVTAIPNIGEFDPSHFKNLEKGWMLPYKDGSTIEAGIQEEGGITRVNVKTGKTNVVFIIKGGNVRKGVYPAMKEGPNINIVRNSEENPFFNGPEKVAYILAYQPSP